MLPECGRWYLPKKGIITRRPEPAIDWLAQNCTTIENNRNKHEY